MLRTATNPSGDVSAFLLPRAAPKRCSVSLSGPSAGSATSTALPHSGARVETRLPGWFVAVTPSGDAPTGRCCLAAPKRLLTVTTRLLAGPSTSSIVLQSVPAPKHLFVLVDSRS
jgi:hypothetical protein